MMNLVAICLILTSIVSGGFFSPPSQDQAKNGNHQNEDLLVREANRVIMVEYERESVPRDHYSHSSPSPSPPQPSALEEKLSSERAMASGVMDSAKDKLKEASSVLPNLGQGVGDSSPSHQQGHLGYNAKEMICDAYGKCKHKLSGVFGKARDGEEAAEKTMEQAKEGLYKAKVVGESAVGSAKEVGESVIGRAKDVGESAMGRAKETGETVQEKAKGTGKVAMEKTKEGFENAKEMGLEGFEKAKDTVYGTGEKAKEGYEVAKENLSEKAQEVKQSGKAIGEKTIENAERVGQVLKKGNEALWDERRVNTKASGLLSEGIRNFTDVFSRGKAVFIDAAKHAASQKVVSPAMGVVLLLCLSTAYGVGMWVTLVSSHVLAQVLSNQQLGLVQSKVYPAYFRLLAASLSCALLAHALKTPSWGLQSLQTYNMLLCLALVLINLFVVEPKATKLMFDKMKVEKEEGRGSSGEGEELVEPLGGPGPTMSMCTDATRSETAIGSARTATAAREEEYERVRSELGALNRRLMRLNTISSTLNVLQLTFLSWQLVYLGKGLPAS